MILGILGNCEEIKGKPTEKRVKISFLSLGGG